MTYTSESMDRVTGATRVMAGVSAILGVGLVGYAVAAGQWRNGGPSVHMAVGAGAFYLFPAAVLFALAWRMDKAEAWAFVCTAALSGLLLLKFAMSYLTWRVGGGQFYEDPIVCEVIGRLPCIYLVIGCMNVMPDVADAWRRRRRDRQFAARGFAPVMPDTAGPVPPPIVPPPPLRSIRRPTVRAVPPGRA